MISECRNFPELGKFYVDEVMARGHKLVRRAVQRGLDSGEFRDLDPDYVARLIFAPLVLMVVWRYSFDFCSAHQPRPGRYIEQHLDILLRGLLAPSRGRLRAFRSRAAQNQPHAGEAVERPPTALTATAIFEIKGAASCPAPFSMRAARLSRSRCRLAARSGCQKSARSRTRRARSTPSRSRWQPDDQEASYTGDVRARWESALGFRVPGKIVARLVEVGQQVKKGQVLARLDPEDQKLSAEAAKQQLVAARSDYRQAKADLVRYKDLFDKGFISAAEYDKRKTTYDTAAARLEQATAQLELNRNQTAYTTLHADQDGVVTAVQAEVGQVVTAGPDGGQSRAPGREGGRGQRARRTGWPSCAQPRKSTSRCGPRPGKNYKGRIREISPSADNVTRTYTVKVTRRSIRLQRAARHDRQRVRQRRREAPKRRACRSPRCSRKATSRRCG